MTEKRMLIEIHRTQNYESKSNILLREHGRLISGMAEKYKPMLEERLQLQKVRLEGEQDILNRLSARASDELRKELSDERGITELLRAQVQRLAASEKQLKEQLQTEKTNTESLVQHIGELTLEKEALESQPEPEQSKTSTLQGEVPDLI
jgi:chromosome segregation ATPase